MWSGQECGPTGYFSVDDLFGCLCDAAVRASDFRSSGRGFDSQPGRNHVTCVNSAFHPSRVGKSSTSFTGCA